jgi:hypothetical protein
MRRPAAALALCIVLAGGVSACGGDEESSDVIPKSTPDLVAPANASLGAATTRDDEAGSGTSTTSTTSTTQTGTAPAQGTTTQQAPAAPAQTTPAEAPPEGTGGAGATTTPPSGGTDTTTGGGSGGFSDFCQQNPGACPE